MLNFVLLLVGSVGLYLGAEWLVKGASGLAATLGVRPLAIGITVVAYGTSAPEMTVSTVSALAGKSDIALGNVIGSNIANIGLILGITAMIAPPTVQAGLMRRELPVMLGATLAVPLLLLDGVISRIEGGLLLFAAAAFTWITLRSVTPNKSEGPEQASAPQGSKARLGLITALGLGVLVGGGKLFVDGAVGLALAVGISERVVGLTVVAVGTSLPELAASLVAALRGHSEIAVGNVLGSNIFNVCLILGTAALVHPIAGELGAVRLELVALGVLTLICAVSMRTARKIQRFEGAFLVVLYGLFLVVLVIASRRHG